MRFTINTEPIAKARARTVVRGGRVMSYTPKATSEAEGLIRAQIANKKEFFEKGKALVIAMKFYISRPPSVSKKRILPVTRPDLDNYCKLVMDACNKYLWEDDSQICELHAFKYYGSPPRIEVEIKELK